MLLLRLTASVFLSVDDCSANPRLQVLLSDLSPSVALTLPVLQLDSIIKVLTILLVIVTNYPFSIIISHTPMINYVSTPVESASLKGLDKWCIMMEVLY